MLYLTLPSVKEVMGQAIENFPPGYTAPPESVIRRARLFINSDARKGSVQIQVAQYGLVTLSGDRAEKYRFEPLDSYRASMNRNLPAVMEGVGLP